MDLNINLAFINIGSATGILSLLIIGINFFRQRYSFFKYIDYQPELMLLVILCKAEKEGYKFIKIWKDRVTIGHTQGNRWIKPYKCFPNVLSRSSFPNEGEVYVYKIDLWLLLMIKVYRKFKNQNILSVIEKIDEFNAQNSQARHPHKVEFFSTMSDSLVRN